MFFAQVDPLVSLMMVEKVPDSTYEMVGGLDKQIKEIKEVIELPVKHPELFEALGIAQPKVSYVHHVTHSVGAEEWKSNFLLCLQFVVFVAALVLKKECLGGF